MEPRSLREIMNEVQGEDTLELQTTAAEAMAREEREAQLLGSSIETWPLTQEADMSFEDLIAGNLQRKAEETEKSHFGQQAAEQTRSEHLNASLETWEIVGKVTGLLQRHGITPNTQLLRAEAVQRYKALDDAINWGLLPGRALARIRRERIIRENTTMGWDMNLTIYSSVGIKFQGSTTRHQSGHAQYLSREGCLYNISRMNDDEWDRGVLIGHASKPGSILGDKAYCLQIQQGLANLITKYQLPWQPSKQKEC